MLRRNWLVAVVLMVGLMVSLGGCSKTKKTTGEDGIKGTPTETTPDKEGDKGLRPGREGEKPADFDAKVQTIFFDFDKSNIRGDQATGLEGNANYLKEHADLKILIEGHCDERGSLEYNFALGQRRATSVREFLISRGVAAERLSIVSFGKEKPADPGRNETAWAKNRRAEFKVTQ